MNERFFSKEEKIRDSFLITTSSLVIAGVSYMGQNPDLKITAGVGVMLAILSGVKMVSLIAKK